MSPGTVLHTVHKTGMQNNPQLRTYMLHLGKHHCALAVNKDNIWHEVGYLTTESEICASSKVTNGANCC
jgi:hypothetical protein